MGYFDNLFTKSILCHFVENAPDLLLPLPLPLPFPLPFPLYYLYVVRGRGRGLSYDDTCQYLRYGSVSNVVRVLEA